MKKITSNKGITLVALIITIIVLLILAMVAIKAVTGDGIIEKATKAQKDYSAAKIAEDVQLDLNEWKILKAIEGKGLGAYLTESGKYTNITGDDDTGYTVEKDGYRLTISKDGKVEENPVLVSEVTPGAGSQEQPVPGSIGDGGDYEEPSYETTLASVAQYGDIISDQALNLTGIYTLTAETSGYSEDQYYNGYTGNWYVFKNDGTNVTVISDNIGNVGMGLIGRDNIIANGATQTTILDTICQNVASSNNAGIRELFTNVRSYNELIDLEGIELVDNYKIERKDVGFLCDANYIWWDNTASMEEQWFDLGFRVGSIGPSYDTDDHLLLCDWGVFNENPVYSPQYGLRLVATLPSDAMVERGNGEVGFEFDLTYIPAVA